MRTMKAEWTSNSRRRHNECMLNSVLLMNKNLIFCRRGSLRVHVHLLICFWTL